MTSNAKATAFQHFMNDLVSTGVNSKESLTKENEPTMNEEVER